MTVNIAYICSINQKLIKMKKTYSLRNSKNILFIATMCLISTMLRAQVTTAQIKEQLANGECETAQALYNVYKTMNGTNNTIEREIADCKGGGTSGYEEDLTFTVNGISFTMKYVEGGVFWKGAQNKDPKGRNYDKDASDNEGPVKSDTLDSYYLGETEVTQALWEAVMGTTLRQQRERRNPEGKSLTGEGEDYPMYYVSFDDCEMFIDELNRMTGQSFRLPTGAEWEYAARGGNKSMGCKYAGSHSIDKVAWYGDNSEGVTHLVKTKNANELGLFDMCGNVCEWCSGVVTVEAHIGVLHTSDGRLISSSSSSVVKYDSYGGCIRFNANRCRVSSKNNIDAEKGYSYVGFRICLSK